MKIKITKKALLVTAVLMIGSVAAVIIGLQLFFIHEAGLNLREGMQCYRQMGYFGISKDTFGNQAPACKKINSNGS